MTSIQRPRGTRDFLPAEMERRRHIEKLLRDAAERWGFREISTPTFEEERLFIERSGEGIVEELYSFEDKGGRRLALRPEFTAAVMRVYATEMKNWPKPIKLYYFGNAFRYERPQSGRYREFWQFGVETIGCATPLATGESIALAMKMVSAAGVKEPVLRVGHVGILKKIISSLGLPEEKQREAMRALDKGDRENFEEVVSASEKPLSEMLIEYMEARYDLGRAKAVLKTMSGDTALTQKNIDDDVGHLENTIRVAESLGCKNISVDLGIARGLDYYTGVVFEIDAPSLGAEKQVCGGGEYELGTLFGLQPVDSVGFALGFDRLVLASEVDVEEKALDFFVIDLSKTEKTRSTALEILLFLREHGCRADIDLMERGASKALKYASSRGTKWAILVGERDIEKGVVTLRDMKTGEQKEMPAPGKASGPEEEDSWVSGWLNFLKQVVISIW